MFRRCVESLLVASLLLSVHSATAKEEAPPPAGAVSLDRAAASIPKTPEAACKLVRERVSFRPYAGFVKGPEGAWSDGTANAADAADLLQEVLRRCRIPSRLAFGSISGDRATALLRECLSSADRLADVDRELRGDARAEPTKDGELRKIVTDHVWVQAQWQGEWIDLDPVFSDLKPGEAATRPTAVSKAAPLSRRRLLRFEVFAKERGAPGPRLLLGFERPASELAGQRILLVNQGVNQEARDSEPELVQMRPVLFVGKRQYPGKQLDVLARKPGGRLGGVFGPGGGKDGDGKAVVLEEAYLEISLRGAARPDRSERRYLYLAGEGGLDRMKDFVAYHVGFGGPAAAEVADRIAEIGRLAEGAKPGSLPAKGPLTAEHEKQAQAIFDRAGAVAGTLAAWLAHLSDRFRPKLDEGLGVVSDAADARVIGVSIDPVTGAVSTDLVFDPVVAWARRGTKLSAVGLHASLRGLVATAMEESMLAGLEVGDPLCVGRVLRAAAEQEIPVVALAREIEDPMSRVEVPAATARILEERLAAGHLIAIPAKPVEIEGKPVVAWYEIDRSTGMCVGVSSDGRHQAAAEDAENRITVAVIVSFCQSFHSGFDETLLEYAEKILENVAPDMNFPLIHAQALSSLASLDMETVKKIAEELDGKIEDLANSGALCGRAAALVVIWAAVPVK